MTLTWNASPVSPEQNSSFHLTQPGTMGHAKNLELTCLGPNISDKKYPDPKMYVYTDTRLFSREYPNPFKFIMRCVFFFWQNGGKRRLKLREHLSPISKIGSLKRMRFAYFMPQFPPSLFDTLEVPPLKLHTSGQPMRISQFSECKEHVHHPLRGGHIAVNRPSFVLRACSCGLDDFDIT